MDSIVILSNSNMHSSMVDTNPCAKTDEISEMIMQTFIERG